MAITFREFIQKFLIQLQRGCRVYRIHPILFVHRLPAYESPASIALFKKVVESAGAKHIDENSIHGRTLADCHLGLSNRAREHDVAGKSAEQMENAHAPIETLAADFNKLFRRSLKPGGRHPAVGVPDGTESFPITSIAPERPVLDHLSNCEFV